MDTLIHILLACSIAGLGVIIFVAYLITKELEKVIKKLDHKVNNLSSNEQALREMVLMLNQEKQNEKQMKEAIMERLVAQMREKYHINVVDKEKPLDFPNDHK